MKRRDFLWLRGDVFVRISETIGEVHLLSPAAGGGGRSRGSELPPVDVHGMSRRLRGGREGPGGAAGQAGGDPGASGERRRAVRPGPILPVPSLPPGEDPGSHGPGGRETSAHPLGGGLRPGGGSPQGIPGEGEEESLPVRPDDRLPLPARRRPVRTAGGRTAPRIRSVLPRRREGGERTPVRRKGDPPLPDREGRFPADGRRGPPRNVRHSRRLHPEVIV